MLLSSVYMVKLEVLGGQRPKRLKHVTYWYLLCFLGVKNIIYCERRLTYETRLFFDRPNCIQVFLKSVI